MTNGLAERFYVRINTIEKELSECHHEFLRIRQLFPINYNCIEVMNFYILYELTCKTVIFLLS